MNILIFLLGFLVGNVSGQNAICKCDYAVPIHYDDWGFVWNVSHPIHLFPDRDSGVASRDCWEADLIVCEDGCHEQSEDFLFQYSYTDPHPDYGGARVGDAFCSNFGQTLAASELALMSYMSACSDYPEEPILAQEIDDEPLCCIQQGNDYVYDDTCEWPGSTSN